MTMKYLILIWLFFAGPVSGGSAILQERFETSVKFELERPYNSAEVFVNTKDELILEVTIDGKPLEIDKTIFDEYAHIVFHSFQFVIARPPNNRFALTFRCMRDEGTHYSTSDLELVIQNQRVVNVIGNQCGKSI